MNGYTIKPWKGINMYRKSTVIIILGVLALIIGMYRLWFAPLLYKPIFDPKPIMSIDFPKVIDSVYDVPFEFSNLYEKLGPDSAELKQRHIKEQLWFRYEKTTVYITLFNTNQDAQDYFTSCQKSGLPVYSLEGNKYDKYYVTYIKQARADGLGLFMPMDHYWVSSGFLKNNLAIIISTLLLDKNDDSLNRAIKQISLDLQIKF